MPAHKNLGCDYCYFICLLAIIASPGKFIIWLALLGRNDASYCSQNPVTQNHYRNWIYYMNALSLSIVLLVSHLRYGYHQIREVNLIILIHTSSGNQIVLCRGSLFFYPVARVHDMTSDVHRQLVRIMGFPNWSQALFPLCSSWDISLGFPFLFFISFMKRYPLAI